MTLCGAFRCHDGIVMFADRQESIADYAKWDVGKIYMYTLDGVYRVVMTGAGDSYPIDETWDVLTDSLWKIKTFASVKPAINRAVSEVTRKTIFPVPRDERVPMDLIWAVQPLATPVASALEHIQLFHTHRLSSVKMETNYFTGTPHLLAHFINDQYIHGLVLGLDAAEALAAYLLWEVKEYDLYVGKYSDIFTLRNNDSVSRIPPRELSYWDEHWRQFKESLRILPLLSCVTSDRMYNINDRLKSFSASLRLLQKESRKVRQQYSPDRSDLERKLRIELLKVARRGMQSRHRKVLKSQTLLQSQNR